MKKLSLVAFILIHFCCLSAHAYSWTRSIELGYGYSQDPNHTKYHNSGVLLSGDLYPLWCNPWTFFSITGSLGHWYTTAPENKNLTTAAASLALRLYPVPSDETYYPFYFLASFGPAYLSSRQYGENTQGSHWAIQSNLGIGEEFDSFDVNLRLSHFSNAGLAKPNEGFNVLYLLSVGYLF